MAWPFVVKFCKHKQKLISSNVKHVESIANVVPLSPQARPGVTSRSAEVQCVERCREPERPAAYLQMESLSSSPSDVGLHNQIRALIVS